MEKTFFYSRILILLSAFLLSYISHGAQEIYISKGVRQPIPIALNDLSLAKVTETKIAKDIIDVIKSDLNSCGIFALVSQDSFIETTKGIEHVPHFVSWRQVNANLLLNGKLEKISDKLFSIKFTLWDTITQKSIISLGFKGRIDSWRRVAHQVADKIYESITGDNGYFDTRIFYIAEKNQRIKGSKRIAVMDYDGFNHEFLTNDRVLNITPRLSPNSEYLLYVSYLQGAPKVFMKNLKTGRSKIFIDVSGMSFAPRFSPDGSKIIFSLAKNGVTNIWEMDLKTHKMKQLTKGFSISTSPTYSPDAKIIYFNSDRNGSKQIYSMKHDGSEITRISFGDGSYSSPIISPNGKYVAFIKSIRGENFYLGVMDKDGLNERLIANGYLVDSISWSPNSRMIAFAKTSKGLDTNTLTTKIYTTDIEGLNERKINTPEEATDPEWSLHH